MLKDGLVGNLKALFKGSLFAGVSFRPLGEVDVVVDEDAVDDAEDADALDEEVDVANAGVLLNVVFVVGFAADGSRWSTTPSLLALETKSKETLLVGEGGLIDEDVVAGEVLVVVEDAGLDAAVDFAISFASSLTVSSD